VSVLTSPTKVEEKRPTRKEFAQFAVCGAVALGGMALIFLMLIGLTAQPFGVVQVAELLAGVAMVVAGSQLMPEWVKTPTE